MDSFKAYDEGMSYSSNIAGVQEWVENKGWTFLNLGDPFIYIRGNYVFSRLEQFSFGDNANSASMTKTIPGNGGCIRVRYGNTCCGAVSIFIDGDRVDFIDAQAAPYASSLHLRSERIVYLPYESGDVIEIKEESNNWNGGTDAHGVAAV